MALFTDTLTIIAMLTPKMFVKKLMRFNFKAVMALFVSFVNKIFSHVLLRMEIIWNDDKIRNIIIQTIMIKMVNLFGCFKWPSKKFFHDNTMLIKSFFINTYLPISTGSHSSIAALSDFWLCKRISVFVKIIIVNVAETFCVNDSTASRYRAFHNKFPRCFINSILIISILAVFSIVFPKTVFAYRMIQNQDTGLRDWVGATPEDGASFDTTYVKLDWSNQVTADPLSLHLDQTTPQTVVNGQPIFNSGIKSSEIRPVSTGAYIDVANAEWRDNFTTIAAKFTFGSRYLYDGNGDVVFDFNSDTAPKFSGLTSNGFLKTGSSDGTLSVDTGTYIPTGAALLLDQTTPQTFTNLGGGTGLMKVTAGLLGLDTNTYLTSLSGALLATGATTGATSQAQAFTNGVITGKIYPSADSATAVQITKADGTTSLFNVDTTNSGVYIRGTQNPANYLYAFAVNQTGGTGNTIFSRWSNDTTPASLVLGKSRSASIDTYSYLSSGDVIGRIAFSPAISGRFSSQGTSARIDGSASEAHGAAAKGTKIDFYTVPNTTLTTITALTISDAGHIKLPADNRNLYFGAADDASITFDGNSLNITANVVTSTDDLILTARAVGIGTTTPNTLLNENNGQLAVSSAGTTRIAINSGGNNAGFVLGESGVAKYSIASYNGGNFTIYDDVNNLDRLFISSAGLVGIGTAVPAYKLHVKTTTGDSRVVIDAPSGSYNGLNFYVAGADQAGIYYRDSDARFQFWSKYSGSWYERMSLLDAGGLGIGTAAPLNKLDVNGAAVIGSYAGANTAPTNGLLVSGSTAIGNTTNVVGTATYRLLVTTAGSGTTDAFGIQDTTAAGYSNFHLIGTGRTFQIGVGNASETYFGVPDKYFVYDRNATLMRMVIDTSGNMGIGLVAPSARLHSLSTTEQLRLGYDASNYLSVTVGSGGDTTITSSGGDISFDNENIGTTGAVKGVHKAADGTAAVADGTYSFYNDGVTSGQVTSMTIKDGVVTSLAQIP